MPYKIKNDQLKALIKNAVIASKDGGKEICGLIVDTGYFLELIQVRNKIKTGGSFRFYVPEIRNIEKAVSVMNFEIVGTFHSHPLSIAKPGNSDLTDVSENELMLIIDCIDKHAVLWKIINGEVKKATFKVI